MEIRTTLAGAQLPESTAVAIGCFDGVHLAHRRILENVIRQKKNGLRPAVFTFPIPLTKMFPSSSQPRTSWHCLKKWALSWYICCLFKR